MLDSVRRFFSPLPSEHKAAFFRQAFGENISRLVLCSSLLIVAEGAIYLFFPGQILGTDRAIGFFVLGNLLGFPVLLLLYKRKNTLPLPVLHGAQLLYFLGTLAFSWALTLVPQPELVSINTYSIAVFAIAVFFVLPPLEGFLLYLFAYLGFYFLFPLYQTNPHIVLVLRINTFVMTLLAWVFGRVTFLLRLKNFIDRGTIEEANRRLKDLTIRDSMTGLFNHDHSFFNLEIEIERSKRFHRPLSVIMMDIDNFKSINDRFGHQAGDEVIIRVAEILKTTCRATDVAGRYGGEEFILIMPNAGLEEAAIVAERIRSSIERIDRLPGERVTISGGISEYAGATPERFLESADQKLYRAKELGKNRFETEL